MCLRKICDGPVQPEAESTPAGQSLPLARAGEGMLYLFAVNLSEAEVKPLIGAKDAAAQLLGITGLDAQYTELFRIKDLDELGLEGYLSEGYDVAADLLQPARARLGALEGYALIVLSSALPADPDNRPEALRVGAALTHIESFPLDGPDWSSDAPLKSRAATEAPPPRKAPSDAAMMGRVATIVLLLLFALTGLMVWIAG